MDLLIDLHPADGAFIHVRGALLAGEKMSTWVEDSAGLLPHADPAGSLLTSLASLRFLRRDARHKSNRVVFDQASLGIHDILPSHEFIDAPAARLRTEDLLRELK